MKKNQNIFFFLYEWLIYIPFLAVSTLIFGSLAVIISSLVSKKLGSYIGGTWWAKLNAFAAGMHVTVKGFDNIDPKRSYVITSNHLSFFDIFLIYGWIGVDFRWVMKAELRKVPFLGGGCAAIGHIFIDRSDNVKAVESINRAKESIHSGTSVLFFPEGRRNNTGKLLPFKKGAFKFALDMGLPILPVTITGTDQCQPTGTLKVIPGRVTLTIQEPIETSQYSDDTIDELMAKTAQAIENRSL